LFFLNSSTDGTADVEVKLGAALLVMKQPVGLDATCSNGALASKEDSINFIVLSKKGQTPAEHGNIGDHENISLKKI